MKLSVSHSSHSPWKSLKNSDYHIPTARLLRGIKKTYIDISIRRPQRHSYRAPTARLKQLRANSRRSPSGAAATNKVNGFQLVARMYLGCSPGGAPDDLSVVLNGYSVRFNSNRAKDRGECRRVVELRKCSPLSVQDHRKCHHLNVSAASVRRAGPLQASSMAEVTSEPERPRDSSDPESASLGRCLRVNWLRKRA